MKIEIWSDVMCPFCYIGKRNFETALAQFADKKHIEVIWKSFQLDPTLSEVAQESQEDYLIKRKGMSREQVQGLLAHVTQMAKQVGLDYNLEQSVMVNSLKAHQFIQFAKTKNRGDQAEEALCKAYFTDGKNIADIATLTQIGKEIGLSEHETKTAFTDDQYAYLANQDIMEAREIGVNGVPFFVFNRKYAISGAQPEEVFMESIEKSFAEWRQQNPESPFEVIKGDSCSADGVCE